MYCLVSSQCLITVAVIIFKVITRNASHRIVKFAFDLATKYGRKKVTLVHKANIMKQGDGMFLRTGQKVAKLYPDIQFEDIIIDNMCMQSVSRPQQFDVVGQKLLMVSDHLKKKSCPIPVALVTP